MTLVKVLNDLLLAYDQSCISLVILDTITHNILPDRLENVSVKGTALSWLSPHLTAHYHIVDGNGVFSTHTKVKSGVPQGSLIGPLVFSLYML